MQTREQAEKEYDKQLGWLVNSLRSLADQVERTGQTHRDHVPRLPDTHDRVFAASEVQNKVTAWFGGHNSYLIALWYNAIRAEHATARGTPAELLDLATTGLRDVGPADPHTEDEHLLLAEAALRGAGVIR